MYTVKAGSGEADGVEKELGSKEQPAICYEDEALLVTQGEVSGACSLQAATRVLRCGGGRSRAIPCRQGLLLGAEGARSAGLLAPGFHQVAAVTPLQPCRH